MGRWLNRVHAGEENTGMPVWRTDRTDETVDNEVLSVSSASQKRERQFSDTTDAQHLDGEDQCHALEERTAILEYDEGLSRAEAEKLAADQMATILQFRREA